MFRVNRPFRIGKLFKVRINKKSLGLTFGGKYFRTTLNTKGDLTTSAGGAGTGLYLSKSTNLKRKNINNKTTMKARCQSLTKRGTRCKNYIYSTSKFCKTHLTSSPNSLDVKIESGKKGVAVFTYDELNEKSTQNLKDLGSRLNEIEGTMKIFNEEVTKDIFEKYGDFTSLGPDTNEYKNSIIPKSINFLSSFPLR